MGKTGDLQQSVFAVVTTDFDIRQMFLVRQFADLERIAGGDEERETAGPQFLENRLEEWNMRCVVEVDPDLGLIPPTCAAFTALPVT